jgi:cell wall-associated NlpC family hydrolase
MGSAGGIYRQGIPAPAYQCRGPGPGQTGVYCENAGDIGFDCSGLMFAMWRAAGVAFPCADSSAGIAACSRCTAVAKSALQPCDMMVYAHRHVVMFIGGGSVVQSSPHGTPVNGVVAGTEVSPAAHFISSADYVGVRCPL